MKYFFVPVSINRVGDIRLSKKGDCPNQVNKHSINEGLQHSIFITPYLKIHVDVTCYRGMPLFLRGANNPNYLLKR